MNAPTYPLPGPALLFCPGNRPDRFDKAIVAADGVILDLEDGVPPEAEAKAVARTTVAGALRDLDPGRTIVRVNPLASSWGEADLDALGGTPLRTILVPKAEDPAAIAGLSAFAVIALCETAVGVLDARALAAAESCAGIVWGAEDLTADLGGRASRAADGTYLLPAQYARATVLLAARAARVTAIDGVWLDIPNLAGLEAEAREGVAMGYAAKLAIHPTQVPVIRAAYRPAPQEVDRARRLLGVAAEQEGKRSVFAFEGVMVDGPLLAQARAIVAAAEVTADA